MPTFIDIGAMKGEEVDLALQRGFDVYAFEPNPHLKDYLFDKYKDNHHVSIKSAAAWDTDGESFLYSMFNPEPGEDGVSLIKEKANVSKINFVRVQTINIGKFLSELDKDIDILKINTEGAEYIILESILDNFDYKRIKVWTVEDHSNYIEDEEWREKREEVLKRIKDLGIEIINWNNTTRHELLG